MCTAVLIGWDPANHPPPRIWAHILVSQGRRHLFVTQLLSDSIFGAAKVKLKVQNVWIMLVGFSAKKNIQPAIVFVDFLGTEKLLFLIGWHSEWWHWHRFLIGWFFRNGRACGPPEVAVRPGEDCPQHPLHQDSHPETGWVWCGKYNGLPFFCSSVY